MEKAIFVDKDCTLIPDIPYNVDPARISLMPHVLPGLKRLQKEGYLLIIISNQSGVAKGHFEERELTKVIQKIVELLAAGKVNMHDFYYCPHHPDGKVKFYARECECRKPKPGLLLRAARDWKIDLPSSWMIGDILDDVEAGRRAGCQTILLDNGNETEWRMDDMRQPHHCVKNIEQAAHIILSTKTGYAAIPQ